MQKGVDKMKLKSKFLTAVAALAVVLLFTSVASANTITISVTGGTPASVSGNGDLGPISYLGHTASFTTVTVSALGSGVLPEPDLDTTTIDATTHSSGTLTIDVLETGLTTPINHLTSAFSTSKLPAGWTVAESTFINGVLVDSQTFAATGGVDKTSAVSVGATYTEMEQYVITATHSGSIAAGITTTSVPEPATLTLIGMGLLGLLGIRKKENA